MPWDFSADPEFEREIEWMTAFVKEEILPLETLDLDFAAYHRLTAPLRQEVKTVACGRPSSARSSAGQASDR
jgi:acyl-CoA dehydrogenase